MKIAVASQNRISITSHTGKCQKFWIYEVNSKEVLGKELLELPQKQTFYKNSPYDSHPYDSHPLDDIQVLISGGIGRGLMRRLEKQGIEGIVTLASDPDLAVIAYLENSLVKKKSKPQKSNRQHPHGRNHQYRFRHARKLQSVGKSLLIFG